MKATRLGFTAGTIEMENLNAFEKLLFRATRGNMYLRYADVGTVTDPNSGKDKQKAVFVVFFAGERARLKVTKVPPPTLHVTFHRPWCTFPSPSVHCISCARAGILISTLVHSTQLHVHNKHNCSSVLECTGRDQRATVACRPVRRSLQTATRSRRTWAASGRCMRTSPHA